MKRIIMLVFVLLLSGCITKENKLEDVVVEEVKSDIVEVTDVQTVDQQLDVDALKLIDLDYDAYDLRAKDNDLELIDCYKNMYLFVVYDTNTMGQLLPTLKTIFKTKDKEYVIEDITINNGIIKNEHSFYHFVYQKNGSIELNRYDVASMEDYYVDSFEIKSMFNAPDFFRDNHGTIYFTHFNNQTESLDIYKEKDNQFEIIHSIFPDERGSVYSNKELFHIIDNILYYVRGSEKSQTILTIDLNTKEEKLLYQFNRKNIASSSLAVLNNTLAISLTQLGTNALSELYLIQDNQQKLLFYNEEFYNNLHLLNEHTLLFSSRGESGWVMNTYNINTNIRSKIKNDDSYLNEVFLVYDNQINIGFYRQQRYYKLDIDDLIH